LRADERRNAEETFTNLPLSKDTEGLSSDLNLRRSNSIYYSKKTPFSIRQKFKEHLSQKAPKRLGLGKINETFSELSHSKPESLESSFGLWDLQELSFENEEKLFLTQARHRSLGDGQEKMAKGVQKGKLSLPEILPNGFPGMTNMKEESNSEPHCISVERHCNGLKMISIEDESLDQRPQRRFLMREEQKSTLRVNSLYEKIEMKRNACKNLQAQSRNLDSPLNETAGLGMISSYRTKKLLKSSSVESGLKEIEVNKVSKDVDKSHERNPNKLKSRSLKGNVKKHFKGSSMKNSTPSGGRQWTYIQMKELSSSESGRTVDCYEGNRLTLTRVDATFGSDRSYASSTITILKSFEDLNENEALKTENLTSESPEVNLESENAQTLEMPTNHRTVLPLNEASRNHDQVYFIFFAQ